MQHRAEAMPSSRVRSGCHLVTPERPLTALPAVHHTVRCIVGRNAATRSPTRDFVDLGA